MVTASAERNSKFVWLDEFTARGPKKPVTYRVGVAMANKDNGDGKGFFASAEEMSAATPYTLRPVKAAVADLMQDGWIERSRRGGRSGNGTKWASEYRLTIPPQGARSSTSRPGQGARSEHQGARSSTPLDPTPLDPPISLEAPCFCHGRTDCPDKALAEISHDERSPCGCFPGTSCPECRGDLLKHSKHSPEKLRQFYEQHVERDEGLGIDGTPLGQEKPSTGYLSRERA